MFARILAACIGTVITAASPAAADNGPYTAYVIAEGAEIVAGPGHRFYATDRLSRGTKVEVYREEPSGWLAIRPPDGAFSWTPAAFIERLADDDQVGRVKEPVGSWVGTAVERTGEHHQQVMLKAGELVQILGEKTVTGKQGKPAVWLKIAPPAGEFRWIHLRDVSRQMPVDPPPLAAAAPRAADEAPRDESSASHAADANDQEVTPPPEAKTRAPREPARIELPGEPIAIRPLEPREEKSSIARAQYQRPAAAPRTSLSPDGFVPRKRRDGETSFPPGSIPRASGTRTFGLSAEPAARIAARSLPVDTSIASSAPTSSPAAPAKAPSSPGLASDEIDRQLDQLEVELSLMLAQDRTQWNLTRIQQRATALVEGGADPAARGRARLLLDKIKQFEEAFNIPAAPANRAGLGATNDGTSATASAGDQSYADPRYDAQGWLKPVVSRKGDTPPAPYAVVDADGQPLCFVSPAPGLNLNRYLNQSVGLYGRRGYLEQLKKPHVVAERIIALDSKVR